MPESIESLEDQIEFLEKELGKLETEKEALASENKRLWQDRQHTSEPTSEMQRLAAVIKPFIVHERHCQRYPQVDGLTCTCTLAPVIRRYFPKI